MEKYTNYICAVNGYNMICTVRNKPTETELGHENSQAERLTARNWLLNFVESSMIQQLKMLFIHSDQTMLLWEAILLRSLMMLNSFLVLIPYVGCEGAIICG